jgi:hypothetical protein
MNHDNKQVKAETNLTKILLPSVLSILLCMTLLCGMTWAWFASTQSTPAATIQAATYRIDVVAKNGETVLTAGQDGKYSLAKDVAYTVTLTASGNASKGYCKVTLPDNSVLRTAQIAPKNSLTFTLTLTSDGNVSFSPEWGTYSGEAEITPEHSTITK